MRVLKLIGQIIEIQKQEIPCELATSALIQMLWLLHMKIDHSACEKSRKRESIFSGKAATYDAVCVSAVSKSHFFGRDRRAASISKSTALNLFKGIPACHAGRISDTAPLKRGRSTACKDGKEKYV